MSYSSRSPEWRQFLEAYLLPQFKRYNITIPFDYISDNEKNANKIRENIDRALRNADIYVRCLSFDLQSIKTFDGSGPFAWDLFSGKPHSTVDTDYYLYETETSKRLFNTPEKRFIVGFRLDTLAHNIGHSNATVIELAKLATPEARAECIARTIEAMYARKHRQVVASSFELHRAVAQGREDRVRRLLQADTDVNSRDESLWTPLHSAAIHNRVVEAKLLLRQGADINAMDDKNRTPLDLALYQRNHEVAELLTEHGGTSTGTMPSNPCFVATAVFEDENCWEVQWLRCFRDQHLSTNTVGRAFVQVYMAWGPKLAAIVSRANFLKRVFRFALGALIRFLRFFVP